MRTRIVSFLILISALVPAFSAEAVLTDRQQAKILAAKHLLHLIGRPEAPALVTQKKLENDAYWQVVFAQSGRPLAPSLIVPDIKNALANLPLINAQRPSPETTLKIILKSLAPLPVVPVSSLPEAERKRALAFANGALKKFSSSIYKSPRDFDAEIADVALAAGSAFQSSLIAEEFNRLGNLSSDVRVNGKEAELLDAKDRLNGWLHLWGLHLVMDLEKLDENKLNLAAYVVDRTVSYDVLGSRFDMAEVSPLVEQEYYPALGHAETEQGFLVIFAQTVNQDVASTKKYLSDPALSYLANSPAISSASARAMDAIVRDEVPEGADLRARLIDTTGHHEGFHKYIEPTLAESVRRGLFSENEKAVYHEAGAYLYQIESSDPNFTPLEVMMTLATAENAAGAFYANGMGSAQALERLRRELPNPSTDPIVSNAAVELFKWPSATIKKAAEAARRQYEVDVRNGAR